MKHVITPVGTSLFTNSSDTRIKNGFEHIEDKPASEYDQYVSRISALETLSEGFIRNEGISASAELQSTAVIQNKLQDEITLHLLASDTIASRLAAKILMNQINDPNHVLGNDVEACFDPDEDVIGHLQVKDTISFSREGMPNLFQRIDDIRNWDAYGGEDLAINITGGYGATLPYLTIFAQLKGVPLYYNFEDQDELITIPQAPLAIDSSLIERYAGILTQIVDRIDDPNEWRTFKSDNMQAVRELDAFIWEDDELGAELSPMGSIFWNDYLEGHFVIKLPLQEYTATYPNHCYYVMNEQQQGRIDYVIREFYRELCGRLGTPLPAPDKCFKTIRDLSHNDNLNHTGQIPGRDIFIFKTSEGHGKEGQVRMLYSFKVNNQKINEITIYAILYQRYKRFNHSTYDEQWKDLFGEEDTNGDFQNLPDIAFDKRTFDVPS